MIQEYGDRNGLNRPQSASDARADDDRRSNQPTPTHRFCHSAIFRPITPYNVWFFWVSRHRSIILAKKKNGNIFGQILRNSRKCVKTWVIENVNWSQKHLGILPSSLWNVFLKFFLQMNPIKVPMRKKKTAIKHHFIALLAREEKNNDVFFGYFFVWVPIFDPTLVQYFIQIPHIMFCCLLSAYDKWWFEQKKSPHFQEKYLVLSYLNIIHAKKIFLIFQSFSKFNLDVSPVFICFFISKCLPFCRLLTAEEISSFRCGWQDGSPPTSVRTVQRIPRQDANSDLVMNHIDQGE